MEQTLHDIAREMTPEEDATDDQDVQQSMTELQDWDEEPLENTAKHPFRWKFIVLILVLAGHSLILPAAKEGLSFYSSPGFQTRVGGRARIGDHGGHEPVLLYIKPWHCGNGDLRELHVEEHTLAGEAVRICGLIRW